MKSTEDIVRDFFKKNKAPSDTQIHELADKLELNPHKFEEIIYKMLSSEINRGD